MVMWMCDLSHAFFEPTKQSVKKKWGKNRINSITLSFQGQFKYCI